MTKVVSQFPLGRYPSPFDPRDFNLAAFKPKLTITTVTEREWAFNSLPLNQEATNHCVGFSGADFGINDPIQDNYTDADGHRFYYMCKVFDGDPTGEMGSNIRSIAKTLRQEGRIDAYAFASDMATIKYWLLNRGPLIVGTIWTDAMFNPDANGVIEVGGTVVGGHAYVLNKWTKDNFIRIQNSWGLNWGINGQGYISAANFEKIFRYGGEAVTAVELPLATTGESKRSCLFPFFK